MRVLFLGGTTLTGPYAVRRLHSLGHEVTVFHRGEHETDLPPGVRHVHGELAKLPQQMFHPLPDVVVHMWAMTQRDAESLLAAFRGRAGQALVISSGDVYRAYGRFMRLESGPPDPIPLAEDAPLRQSRYPYRKVAPNAEHWMAQYDKILVEQVLIRQTELPTTILRFPAVFGAKEYRRFKNWLQPMVRGEPDVRIQEGWATWRWTHGFVEDVAEAIVFAATKPLSAGRIYNAGEAQTPTMAERLAEYARAAGWRGRILETRASDLSEGERMPYDFSHHIVYDTTRIRTELGFKEVVPHDQVLARTLEFEKEG
ncbi:MAG: NAD-dependent epimerase/dehydratase family protein [Bryobacterales bacterium]|nr:NAD-dependent epimerase/dehydratase family protein [Bryobacterales bacterium]